MSGSQGLHLICKMDSSPLPQAFLSKGQAIALAQARVDYLNARTPQGWVVAEPVEYAEYWYFDYEAPLLPGQSLVLADCFAYPPGYLVWKQTYTCTLVGIIALLHVGAFSLRAVRLHKSVCRKIGSRPVNCNLTFYML
jgi:hypothetical protein